MQLRWSHLNYKCETFHILGEALMCPALFCSLSSPFPQKYPLPSQELDTSARLPRCEETGLREALRHLTSKSLLSTVCIHVKVQKISKPMPGPRSHTEHITGGVYEATCVR